MIRLTVPVALVAALVSISVGVADAEEAKTPVSAALILDIVAAPVQPRTSAFDEALRRPAPPAPDPTQGEVLPDGSVGYGRTVITVKHFCPPGSEPPPLPGRRPGR